MYKERTKIHVQFSTISSNPRKEIFSIEMPIAAPFMNRIATNRFYDIHYISLHRNDKTPNREHCYHVLFPDYWRKQDIISECIWILFLSLLIPKHTDLLFWYLDAFSYCGHVRVMWINDTSAFVAIEEKQFLPEVKQVIANNKDISVQDRILFTKNQLEYS